MDITVQDGSEAVDIYKATRKRRSSRSNISGVSLWREVCWLVHCGELESAYERVMLDGGEKELVRLMTKTGPCLNLLASHTKALLFTHLAHILNDLNGGSPAVEQVLPWVIKATQTGDALQLPKPIRKELVRGLHRLLAPAAAEQASSNSTDAQLSAKSSSNGEVENKTPVLIPETNSLETSGVHESSSQPDLSAAKPETMNTATLPVLVSTPVAAI